MRKSGNSWLSNCYLPDHVIPLPATVIGNGEDLEGFAGAGLFESVCAEEAGKLG